MKKRESNKYILKNPIALKDYQPNDNMTFNVVLKLIKKEIKQIKESGVRVKIYNEHRHLVHSETVNYIVEHGNTPDYA